MLDMKPGCETCDIDLPPDSDQAFVCSFECTFCKGCTEAIAHVCSNCGGNLVLRPTRRGKALAKHPAVTRRTYKPR